LLQSYAFAITHELHILELVNSGFVMFSRLAPSKGPKRAGVYVITAKFGVNEQPYYVGRTKNLQQRLLLV
jgi:hypothetical protein